MEISDVPSNETEAINRPANPESSEVHNQPEETRNEHVIFISSDSFQGRLRNLMGSDALVEEQAEGPLIEKVTGILGMESNFNKYFQPCILSIVPLRYDENKYKQGPLFKSQQTNRFIRNSPQKDVTHNPFIGQPSTPENELKDRHLRIVDNNSDKSHSQHEEDGYYSDCSFGDIFVVGTEHGIPINVTFKDRLKKLMEPDARIKELMEKYRDPERSLAVAYDPMFEKYIHPRAMSIGPLEKCRFKRGRLFKIELTKNFINYNMSKSAETLLNDILKEIAVLKECYDEVKLNRKNKDDQELAWNFFVDGCALIKFVGCYYDSNESFRNYDIDADIIKHAVTDFFLVENQLPLRVLNLVVESSERRQPLRMSLLRLVEEIVEMIHFEGRAKDEKADSKTDQSFNGANHLLELIWMNFVKSKKKNDNRFDKTKTIPRQFRSVKYLQAAGIILEPDNSSSSLRDISFNRGKFFCKLKIPRFCLNKQSRRLVFNLVAFEMRQNFKNDRVVSSYTSFLNSLIATTEDIVELRKAGILYNYLSNDEDALKAFRGLTSMMEPYYDIFSGTREELIKYFNDKKSMTTGKWLREVIHVYFKSPWTILAFVSATFLLILTIIQTIFSVLAYTQRK